MQSYHQAVSKLEFLSKGIPYDHLEKCFKKNHKESESVIPYNFTLKIP